MTPDFIAPGPDSEPLYVAVDSSHVYWSDNGPQGGLGRANLNGTGANPNFIIGVGFPSDVAVDSSHIYSGNGTSIGRATSMAAA